MITYFSYILLEDEAHFIKDIRTIKNFILTIKEGDIVNIMGLGRLKVNKIECKDYNDVDDTIYREIGLICEYLSEAWTVSETAWINSLTVTIPPAHTTFTDDVWDDYSLIQMTGGGYD